MAGFGKNSGPTLPPKSQPLFGNTVPDPHLLIEPNISFGTPASQMEDHKSPPLNFHGNAFLFEVEQPSDGSISPPKPTSHLPAKRTRSFPVCMTTKEVSTPVIDFDEAEAEREAYAKTKRLARFGTELSQQQPVEVLHEDSKWCKYPDTKLTKVSASTDGFMSMDTENQETSTAIVGLCQDMCPETEREERERKGDLDQYERLDGEKNQTSISIAVKKYTRTAEREAFLIRPMPILQKTMDYLLDLLNQPYNNNFLSMYNFLWDRMRAIRMDLRMQHIFDQHAIIMLEQMIRLHIIVMHELCEYKKGEGFLEGFDAHLNIEQMNKTSVELFQIYDDHRKKGIHVSTEKEFRGYYTLLKLDKHPGYKVEPSELSLDLAKMSSEVRRSQEVLFARDVARACRTGNFVAFFRLAKKATYVQACLMHAHFAKLRTQALASLHSAVQNNQGIPVSQVVNWLGMEGENIDHLLEYHGFSLKMFDEMYMVKESIGFFNKDVDYPTKCSNLVHLKKSAMIVDDVSFSPSPLPVISKSSLKNSTCSSDSKPKFISRIPEVHTSVPAVSISTFRVSFNVSHKETVIPVVDDEEMHDHVEEEDSAIFKVFKKPDIITTVSSYSPFLVGASRHPELISTTSISSLPNNTSEIVEKQQFNGFSSLPRLNFAVQDTPTENFPSVKSNEFVQKTEVSPIAQMHSDFQVENPKSQVAMTEDMKYNEITEEELSLMMAREDEIAMKRLRLILRKWKLQATKLRQNRELRRLSLASLALNSVPIGLPLRQTAATVKSDSETIDIDSIIQERNTHHAKSFCRLNVSDVVGPILITRNPTSRCLIWKLLFCVYHGDQSDDQINRLASTWLALKLMGRGSKMYDVDLIISSTKVSIWKKRMLLTDSDDHSESFCFSVVREVNFGQSNESFSGVTMNGTNAIVYLIPEGVPWEIQRIHLQQLITSIPTGSNLPLLILCHHSEEEHDDIGDIICRLGIENFNKQDDTRICNISVIFLLSFTPDKLGRFLSDDNLRGGLQWLANKSSLQPRIRLLKIRELVLNHLSQSLSSVSDPNICISMFNEALDQTILDIQNAAFSNPNHWPCSEINLIDNSDIRRILFTYLPEVDWSSVDKIHTIMACLQSCKFPRFGDTSWLNKDSFMGKLISNQKLRLEEELIRYLTETAKVIGGGDLAAKEACLMVQRCAFLQVRDTHYYRIVPVWTAIFQRMFNWYLVRLATSPECSSAYVLEDVAVKMSPRQNQSQSLSAVCLDEMVEIGCSFLSAPKEQKSPTVVELLDDSSQIEEEPEKESGKIDSLKNGDNDGSNCGRDKLSLLLEKCNRLLDINQEKLSIFF